MRLWLLLLALVPLAGCAEDGDACSDLPPMRATVESIAGGDVTVRLPDGEPAVLHLPEAVFVREGSDCTKTGPSGVRAGDTLAFEVDAWAESYPVQGWPETAVVLR